MIKVLGYLCIVFVGTSLWAQGFDRSAPPPANWAHQNLDDVPGIATNRALSAQSGRIPLPFSYVPEKLRRITFWWNDVPDAIRAKSHPPDAVSNIRREDYAGAAACQECHPANYKSWSEHPHRWMNAVADDQSVKGDFSGQTTISYAGHRAIFTRENGEFRMQLDTGGTQRVFRITRTLGSRFTQYYIGKLVDGPEQNYDALRNEDHVLPFGYWIPHREWVPIVHIDNEQPDGRRQDPLAQLKSLPYDKICAGCHTTRPIGDWMLGGMASTWRLETFSPEPFSLIASEFLKQSHPQIHVSDNPTARQFSAIVNRLSALSPQESVALGISCEACHNGSKQHVEHSLPAETQSKPRFFPSSPFLFVEDRKAEKIWDRTENNVNWICARCHTGSRPQFAAGMATWNSTEFSDASLGHCYNPQKAAQAGMTRLTCVQCHNPHKATGPKWTASPADDDNKCLKCHKKLEPAAARTSHSHHPEGSEGARCLNCHMPRINEGIQDVVRTHTIFNPTEPRAIEANQPNACNLCHLEKPIDWTLKYLGEWYGKTYSAQHIASNYADRTNAVGLGWLKSGHEATRLVAAETLIKAKANWALPELLGALDDPYLMNRQFAEKNLEEWLGLKLDSFGYRFYMSPAERREPLARYRAAVAGKKSD